MTAIIRILVNVSLALVIVWIAGGGRQLAFAHGDKPHPKCKAGYVLNDQHKCVKTKR